MAGRVSLYGGPALVFMTGALATGAVFWTLVSSRQSREAARFNFEAQQTTDRIEDRIGSYVAMLQGGAGLFSGSEMVTQDEFRRFAERVRLLEDYPGAQGIGYCRRVEPGDKAAFIEEMRRDVAPDFHIFPAGDTIACPIIYLEPLDQRNRKAVGFDMFSDPVRRAAANWACDAGVAGGSSRVTLVQEWEAADSPGFLVYVPVYAQGGVPARSDDRRRQLSGFVYSAFRVRDLMAHISQNGWSSQMAVEIYDGDEIRPDASIYRSANWDAAAPDAFHVEEFLDVAGRQWSLRFASLPEFHAGVDRSGPWFAAAAGMLGTLLLTSIAAARAVQQERDRISAAKLRRSESRYRSLVSATASIVWTADDSGAIIEPQPAWAAFTGQRADEYMGRAWLDALHAEDRERVSAYFVAPGHSAFEVEGRLWSAAHKGHRWFSMRGVPLSNGDGPGEWVCLIVDVHDRKHLEELLHQSRKLESIGRLAGGVAHDFNNLLTAILGSVDLAEMDPDLTPGVRERLATIRDAGDRSSELTKQLLSFARKQVVHPRVVDLNAIVRSMIRIIDRVVGENIAVTSTLADDLGHVRVDPGQMEQVLLNLAANARDAMPRGGRLAIETANAELSAEFAASHAGVTPGPYAQLIVSDTGVGMEKSVQEHIFEPFFTTKERGKGTGLGLATSYGIIRQAGGFIWLYSEPGIGTLFRIYLPRVNAPVAAPTPAPAAVSRGAETILLVEDEPMVRRVAIDSLRGLGYTVISESNAEDAIRAAEAFNGDIQLLVTDVVLPRMSGKDLAGRLSGRRPNLKVLYMSGYTDRTISHHGVLEPGVSFLQKPFSPIDLGRKVRHVLDGTSENAGPTR